MLGPAYARTGSYGCRLHPTAATNHVAWLALVQSGFAPDKPYATYSMFFRLVTRPKPTGTYMNLFEIGNTSTARTRSQFTVFFRHNRLVCDFAYGETMDIGAVPAIGVWHQIRAVVHFGTSTYAAHVRYGGSATKTLRSADTKKAQNVKGLWIHYPSVAVDYTVDIDDIQMATSNRWPGFLA